jgi:hypothetical protein
MIARFIERYTFSISEGYHNRRSSSIFFRAIATYTFVKVVLLWQVSSVAMQFQQIALPKQWSVSKSFLLLSFGIHADPFIFFIGVLLLLVFIIWRGANYLTNILFCWICINLYVINFATGDGSDLILLMLSIYALPLADKPALRNETGHVIQIILFNTARILIQCHIVFIYLNSGIDKLLSESWRSGDAINRIRHYEGLFNPTFPSFFQTLGWDTFFAWATIATEISIAVLIWIKPFRAMVLIILVSFHLMIWWMVSLPDFALIMIVSLLIFVGDDQYAWAQGKIKR